MNSPGDEEDKFWDELSSANEEEEFEEESEEHECGNHLVKWRELWRPFLEVAPEKLIGILDLIEEAIEENVNNTEINESILGRALKLYAHVCKDKQFVEFGLNKEKIEKIIFYLKKEDISPTIIENSLLCLSSFCEHEEFFTWILQNENSIFIEILSSVALKQLENNSIQVIEENTEFLTRFIVAAPLNEEKFKNQWKNKLKHLIGEKIEEVIEKTSNLNIQIEIVNLIIELTCFNGSKINKNPSSVEFNKFQANYKLIRNYRRGREFVNEFNLARGVIHLITTNFRLLKFRIIEMLKYLTFNHLHYLLIPLENISDLNLDNLIEFHKNWKKSEKTKKTKTVKNKLNSENLKIRNYHQYQIEVELIQFLKNMIQLNKKNNILKNQINQKNISLLILSTNLFSNLFFIHFLSYEKLFVEFYQFSLIYLLIILFDSPLDTDLFLTCKFKSFFLHPRSDLVKNYSIRDLILLATALFNGFQHFFTNFNNFYDFIHPHELDYSIFNEYFTFPLQFNWHELDFNHSQMISIFFSMINHPALIQHAPIHLHATPLFYTLFTSAPFHPLFILTLSRYSPLFFPVIFVPPLTPPSTSSALPNLPPAVQADHSNKWQVSSLSQPEILEISKTNENEKDLLEILLEILNNAKVPKNILEKYYQLLALLIENISFSLHNYEIIKSRRNENSQSPNLDNMEESLENDVIMMNPNTGNGQLLFNKLRIFLEIKLSEKEWEEGDNLLEFIYSIFSSSNVDLIRFCFQEKFHELIIGKLNDPMNFVRSSCLRLISLIIRSPFCNFGEFNEYFKHYFAKANRFPSSLLKNSILAEEMIPADIFSLFLFSCFDEDEFPRREAGSGIIDILGDEKTLPIFFKYFFENESTDLLGKRQYLFKKSVKQITVNDIDWEVKRIGIQLLQILLCGKEGFSLVSIQRCHSLAILLDAPNLLFQAVNFRIFYFLKLKLNSN